MVIKAENPTPLWYDPEKFEGVMALAFTLPYKYPIATGLNPLEIDNEYLRVRGAAPQYFDNDWMQTPFTCLTSWFVQPLDFDPLVADTLLATKVLSSYTGQQQPPASLAADANHERSVVIVMLPVKSRAAAFRPPHDDKIDPLSVAYWLIADIVRSLRITARTPLPELHYPDLNPIVPATFGSGPSLDAFRFEERPYAIVLPHLPNRIANVEPTDHATAGRLFGELTRGSIGALIKDHISRAHTEHISGDLRAAVLSFAIACELMLDSVLAAMLWEEGESVQQAARHWANQSSITNRVKRLYSGRLAGSWALEGTGPMARWLKRVVYVRNSVIHSGRTPSRAESHLAGEATTGMTSFVAQRLIENWEKYPKTMAILVGPTMIRQHASGTKREKMLQELERCGPFAVDFHRWRDRWLEQRERL